MSYKLFNFQSFFFTPHTNPRGLHRQRCEFNPPETREREGASAFEYSDDKNMIRIRWMHTQSHGLLFGKCYNLNQLDLPINDLVYEFFSILFWYFSKYYKSRKISPIASRHKKGFYMLRSLQNLQMCSIQLELINVLNLCKLDKHLRQCI